MSEPCAPECHPPTPPHGFCPYNAPLVDEHFKAITARLDEVIKLQKLTNGRVSTLETQRAVDTAVREAEKKAAAEAREQTKLAAERAATVRATLISMGGLGLTVLGWYLGK